MGERFLFVTVNLKEAGFVPGQACSGNTLRHEAAAACFRNAAKRLRGKHLGPMKEKKDHP
jgi:hypothetical protein